MINREIAEPIKLRTARLRVLAAAVLTCTLASAPSSLAATTADGYVTGVNSPRVFALGGVDVTLSVDAECFLVVRGHASHYDPILAKKLGRSSNSIPIPCKQLDLRFGSRVQVIGAKTSRMGFTASSVTLFKQLPISPPVSSAILEEQPHLQKVSGGWSGTLWLDGIPVKVTPQTQMFAAPVGAKLVYRGGYQGWLHISPGLMTKPDPSLPFDPSLFVAGNAVSYHLDFGRSSYASATQLRIWQVQRSLREARFWKKYSVSIRTPTTGGYAPGRRFRFRKVVYVVPSRRVQAWVAALGSSLIPQYQISLSDTGPNKIHFRFYVAEHISPLPFHLVNWKFDPILAMPDGMIIIPDKVLPRLQSEAQLAALLSFAETQVIQKQWFIAWPYLSRNEDTFAPLTPGFAAIFGNQMLRIGIHQLYLAGYDVRVTPFVWTLARGETAEEPIYNASALSQQQRMQAIPRYTAYAFQFIHQYYPDVDYSKLKRGHAEYAAFLKELRQADPQAFAESKK